jgi:putative phosphoribosyl transferase
MLFANRQEAGRRLASALVHFKTQRPVVLALARGGVPVGFEIAQSLAAPLDVLLVRKIGAPGSPELAIGAIVDGEHPERFIDQRMVTAMSVPQSYLNREIAEQSAEIERRRKIYFQDRAPADVEGATAIVVDDGIATGATMRAALRATRRRRPAKLVLSAPVASPTAIEALRGEVDEVVCLEGSQEFFAIGEFYRDFHQVSDEEVVALLKGAASSPAAMQSLAAERTPS